MTSASHGIIAYPITPFGPDGDVDTATLAALLEKLIAAGVRAIAPLGSNGEPTAPLDRRVCPRAAAISGRL